MRYMVMARYRNPQGKVLGYSLAWENHTSQLIQHSDAYKLVSQCGKAENAKLVNGSFVTKTGCREIEDREISDKVFQEGVNNRGKENLDSRGAAGIRTTHPQQSPSGKEADSGRGHSVGSSQKQQTSGSEIRRGSELDDGLRRVGCGQVGGAEFYSSIQRAKEMNPHGASVGLYSPQEYAKMKCFAFDSGKAGVSVKPDGDIVSVFKSDDSNIKGFVRYALAQAVANGGEKLDCFSIAGALPSMYCKCGFIPVCKIKFNREFAPDNWNYERDGEPDIVFMMRSWVTPDEMFSNYASFKAYSDYTDEEVPYIFDAPQGCAYDNACIYRDKKLAESKTSFKRFWHDMRFTWRGAGRK